MLYIIKLGEAADNTGLRLTPDTGLLSTPQSVSDKTGVDNEDADASNRWRFTTMLFPELIPGAACRVESSTPNGEIMIDKANYRGGYLERGI